MRREEVCRILQNIVGRDKVLREEPMRKHTTFRIGGPAEWFVEPDTEEKIEAILSFCRREDIPCLPIGNGSNLLVSDQGISGVVLKLGGAFSRICPLPSSALPAEFCPADHLLLYVQAGALLSGLSRYAQANHLGGLEFAGGIPGTVGGAVRMNAGAYGGEMSQITAASCGIGWNEEQHSFETKVFLGGEQQFSYRRSVYQRNGYLIVGAYLLLRRETGAEEIADKMADYQERRRAKQPLELPSAGSTFKRPAGDYAARLIEKCGLRGVRVGGAQVSEKHCGFVVNVGEATCGDVLQLIRRIQETVRRETGVELEPEVEIVGRFSES